MPISDLKAQMARLPEQPGVYLYSNAAGETIYVGKARVLRDRVRSYLAAAGMSPRIDALLDEAELDRGEHVDEDADEGEDVRMNPERDRDPDDRAQREHAGGADSSREGQPPAGLTGLSWLGLSGRGVA